MKLEKKIYTLEERINNLLDKSYEININNKDIENLYNQICSNKYITKSEFEDISKDIQYSFHIKITDILTDLTKLNSRFDKTFQSIKNNECNKLDDKKNKDYYMSIYQDIAENRNLIMQYDSIFNNIKFDVNKIEDLLQYYINIIKSHEYTIAYVNNTLLDEIMKIKKYIENNENYITKLNNKIDHKLNTVNKNIIESLINTKLNNYFFKLYTNWNNLKEYDFTIYGDLNIKIDIILWTFLNKVKLESINKMNIFDKTKYEMKILNEYIKYSNNNELLIHWDKIKELKFNEYEKQILENLRVEINDKN